MPSYTLSINGQDYDLDWSGSQPPTKAQIDRIVRQKNGGSSAPFKREIDISGAGRLPADDGLKACTPSPSQMPPGMGPGKAPSPTLPRKAGEGVKGVRVPPKTAADVVANLMNGAGAAAPPSLPKPTDSLSRAMEATAKIMATPPKKGVKVPPVAKPNMSGSLGKAIQRVAAPPVHKAWEAPLPEGFNITAKRMSGTLDNAMAQYDAELAARRGAGAPREQMKAILEQYRNNIGEAGRKTLKEGGTLLDAFRADLYEQGSRGAEANMMRAQAEVIGEGGQALNKKVALLLPTTWAAKGLEKFKPTENVGKGIEGANEAALSMFNPLSLLSSVFGAASVLPEGDPTPLLEGVKKGFTDLWDPKATPEQKGASVVNWAMLLAPMALKGVPKINQVASRIGVTEEQAARSMDLAAEALLKSKKPENNIAGQRIKEALAAEDTAGKAAAALDAEIPAVQQPAPEVQPPAPKPIRVPKPKTKAIEPPGEAVAPSAIGIRTAAEPNPLLNASPKPVRVPKPKAEPAAAPKGVRVPKVEDKPVLDRNIDWEGKTYVVKGEDQALYDSLAAERNSSLKALESRLAESKDPAEIRDIKTQITAEFRAHKEKLDDFFANQRQKEKVEAGIEPDLDAQFRAITEQPRTGPVRGMARYNSAKERIKKRMESGEMVGGNLGAGAGGFSAKLVKAHGENAMDIAQMGIGLIEEGVTRFNDWSKRMVADVGETVRPHLEEFWNYAHETKPRVHEKLSEMVQEGQRIIASKEATNQTEWVKAMGAKFGKDFTSIKDAAWQNAIKTYRNTPHNVDDRLATARPILQGPNSKLARLFDTLGESNPYKGISRTAEKILLKSDVATKIARKSMEKIEGKSYLETPEDIEMAVNEMTRIDPKIADAVDKGISIEGNRRSLGLAHIVDGMAKDGLDIEQWQIYRRANREIGISTRKGSPITPSMVLDNAQRIDKYIAGLSEKQKTALAKWDNEFDRYSDAMLDLYEHYGLRPEGWAQRTRLENPNYFPMDKEASEIDMAMRQINPQKAASPDAKVMRAQGGEKYSDGISAMASKTERVIRAGEANKAFGPFMEKAAKNPMMKHWVEDVTDLLDEIEHSKRLGKDPTAKDMAEHAAEMDARNQRQPWEQQNADELRSLRIERKRVTDWIDKNGLENPEGAAKAMAKLKDLDKMIRDRQVMKAASNTDLESSADPAEAVFSSLDRTVDLPEGAVPTITLYKDGIRSVYRLDPFLWDAIRGSQPEAYSPLMALLSAPAKAVRKLTTQNNPIFFMVKNPIQDIEAAYVNYGINPANIVKGYGASGRNAANDLISKVGPSKLYQEILESNGLFGNAGARDFIGQINWMFDPEKAAQVYKVGDELAMRQGVKVLDTRGRSVKLMEFLDSTGRTVRESKAVKGPLDALDASAAMMENGTRIAVFDHVLAKELKLGTAPGLAKRRASYAAANAMNFGETGDLAKFAGRMVPYLAVPGETTMAAARAMRRDPIGWWSRGFSVFTVPKIIEWLKYKDDPEYRRMARYTIYGGLVAKRPDGGWVSAPVDGQLAATFLAPAVFALEAYFGERPIGLDKGDPKEGQPGGALREWLEQERKAVMRYPTPSLLAFGLQKGIYDNTGAVIDVRFQQIREYPGADPEDKQYTYNVQQIDTLLGSLGRLGIRTYGYFTGHEKEPPNPFETFFPRPYEPKSKAKGVRVPKPPKPRVPKP